jgi:hypothetical protein
MYPSLSCSEDEINRSGKPDATDKVLKKGFLYWACAATAQQQVSAMKIIFFIMVFNYAEQGKDFVNAFLCSFVFTLI